MIKHPPAYDIHNGTLRIWSGGDIVAEFPRNYFPGMVLDLVKQLSKDLK